MMPAAREESEFHSRTMMVHRSGPDRKGPLPRYGPPCHQQQLQRGQLFPRAGQSGMRKSICVLGRVWHWKNRQRENKRGRKAGQTKRWEEGAYIPGLMAYMKVLCCYTRKRSVSLSVNARACGYSELRGLFASSPTQLISRTGDGPKEECVLSPDWVTRRNVGRCCFCCPKMA